jgi:hypothetical protein
MASTTWQSAPGGIYKNRFLSDRLLMQAYGQVKFLALTQVPDQEFSSGQGEWINLMRMYEMPDSASSTLSESTRIPIRNVSWGTRSIRVTEMGEGLRVTNFARQLGAFHQDNAFQGALRRQMERSLDTSVARNGIFNSDVKIVATPTSASTLSFNTDGAVHDVANSPMTFEHFGVVADYLAGNIHCPPFVGEEYLFITTRLNTRAVKRDTLIQAIELYLRPGDLYFTGEIFKIENIRVIESHREAAISNSSGTSGLIGEGAFLGDQAIARVEIETPELRLEPNWNSDFGRVWAIAWYGIVSFASFHDVADDGFARIIRFQSA